MVLPCLEHTPPGEVIGSVVWLHGLGASGNDFAPLVPHLDLPNVRFVFPHAPDAPVTINGGHVMPSWYDIRSLDHGRTDREDPEGVRRSAAQVRALIQREVERGVPEDRIVLAGFSQGAAVALFTGLRTPRPLLGLMILSGYLVVPESLDSEATPEGLVAPIWFGHGTRDETVPTAGGRAAYDTVVARGATAEWHDYPMGHEVCGEQVRDIRRWLHARFET